MEAANFRNGSKPVLTAPKRHLSGPSVANRHTSESAIEGGALC